ncbi:ABC transporter ATP-binding protein [Streptoverticillium reticulum]|uniref:ABC transporter ATP-binding protein n=1 Tax=Streptoverticillium reticulum TaxID=1433415 RepID=UPI0039BFA044
MSAAWTVSRRYLWSWLRRSPSDAARVLLWTGVETVPALLSGRLVALSVDTGFLDGAPVVGVLWLVALAACAAVGAYGARGALARTAAIVEPLRDALVAYTVAASLRRATHDDHWRQDLSGVARMTRQVEIVREAVGTLITVVSRFAFTFAGVCIGTLTLDGAAAALIFAPVIVSVACYVLSLRKVARAQLRAAVASEELAQKAGELASSLRDVTACGTEEPAFRRLEAAARETARAEELLARLNAVRTVVLGLSGWLPLVLVLVWARWGDAGTSAGTVLGVLTYVAQSLRPAVQALVQGLGTTGVRLFVTLGRILEGGEEPAVDAPGPAVDGDTGTGGGAAVTLDHVSFAYAAGGNDVLTDLSLHVTPGEHLAVVGPSGIGKSTLAAVMAGTRTPTRGHVTMDGAPLRDIPPERRAYLPQEAYVFTGTLRENLAYLCQGEAEEGRLAEAVEKMGLHELADRIGGLDGVLDPDRLSSGERQLIALARAHASPARLLILDEATCHLDPATEACAEEALRRRGGTLVVVAHRISSARAADRVMVMDGSQVRTGTHAEMLAASPLYRDLVGLWHADAV